MARTVRELVRFAGGVFALPEGFEIDPNADGEVEAHEVTGLVSDEAVEVLCDEDDGRVRLGGERARDTIQESLRDGATLPRVRLWCRVTWVTLS